MTPTQITELCERIVATIEAAHKTSAYGYVRTIDTVGIIRTEFAKVIKSPTPDPEGWIENTGVMPVAGDVLVDVKFASGGLDVAHFAKDWLWCLIGHTDDITHWRLHKPVLAAEGA